MKVYRNPRKEDTAERSDSESMRDSDDETEYEYDSDEANSLSVNERIPLEHGDLVPVYLPALALSRTCKQIYHEAMSMFYFRNRFEVTHMSRARSWIPDKKWGGMGEVGVDFHDAHGDRFLAYAEWTMFRGAWIDTMAPRTTVIIDLYTLCSTVCRNEHPWAKILMEEDIDIGEGSLDITPLVFAQWTCSTPFKFSIVCDNRDGPHLIHGNGPNETDVDGLTETINHIVQDDDLNLKRYQALLGRIGVSRQGDAGVVFFNTTKQKDDPLAAGLPQISCVAERYYPRAYTQQQFHRAPDSKTLVFSEYEDIDQPAWLKLPRAVLTTIVEHVVGGSCIIEIDVDEEMRQHYPASRELTLRNLITHISSADRHFKLKCTSTEPETSFDGFESLRKFLRSRGDFDDYDEEDTRDAVLQTVQRAQSTSFELYFMLDRFVALEDLRIDVSGFIHATAGFTCIDDDDDDDEFGDVTIHVYDSKSDSIQEQYLHLKNIRRFAVDIMESIAPSVWMSYPRWYLEKPTYPIVMNGLGEMVPPPGGEEI